MNKFKSLLFISFFLSLFHSYSQESDFRIRDYFQHDLKLSFKVYETMSTMNDTLLVAQLIMPAAGRLGKDDDHIISLLKKGWIGGVLLLNGTKDGFQEMIKKFNQANVNLPLWYSADAELSLINRKIQGTTPVKNANKINSKEELITETAIIAKELNEIGIHWDFAPVVDASSNHVVGFRSFGSDSSKIVNYSLIFSDILQKNQILATAKHFPGHGFVTGDTHKNLVYIDGEMKEVKYYPELIKQQVASVMVGHLAISNNEEFQTNDRPATLDYKIVTELLQDSLGFQGIIVTDAMNMGGVSYIPDAGTEAVAAGCDVILMPLDEEKLLFSILDRMATDEDFKKSVTYSAMKIIRMKICLGLIP